ncbi:hypothetical protein O7622_01210 [Micromonospora sp. WMMD1076]|uniref:hypothetical protein n=1 Tax=Micromonospora sp. WMMD1076 TaxID=3016103 RepID=UPI002499D41D|nr:hypothetical protein [Micromonospora sp. WMMD1076]WFF07249.1 hypothetical protein O7622_01210 [Micromonospora sp. WMMD1076]
MAENPAVPGEQPASPQVAEQQQSASDWPKPGEEGYVHPDGTEQSQRQLAANRRAAADRAAAGSIIHGAPMATPGPDPQGEAAAAARRAEAYSGKTVQEARADLTAHIREAAEAKAEEVADARPAAAAAQRTAEQPKKNAR